MTGSLAHIWQQTAGPSCVQVLTVSSKYVVENQTGVCIEVKQRGAPDVLLAPAAPDGSLRPMRRLGVGERSALHWEVQLHVARLLSLQHTLVVAFPAWPCQS